MYFCPQILVRYKTIKSIKRVWTNPSIAYARNKTTNGTNKLNKCTYYFLTPLSLLSIGIVIETLTSNQMTQEAKTETIIKIKRKMRETRDKKKERHRVLYTELLPSDNS